MTTLEMEVRLMYHFDFTKNLIVPTVTTGGKLNFEADLLVLTPAGYATAVEIKVSKSDLKNDLKKKHIEFIDKPMKYSGKSGYDFYFGPLKYFWYAVPSELQEAALKQIPSFCGLIVFEDLGPGKLPVKRVVRNPDILFKNKWSDREIQYVARLGAMRIYSLKHNILSLMNNKT